MFQPHFTSHGFSVPRNHRHRCSAAARGRAGRGDQFRARLDGRLPDVQREGEQAVVESGVVQRRQLPLHSHRLSAAQRAHGLVGRHQCLLAYRHLCIQCRPVLDAPHAGDARRAGADGRFTDIAPVGGGFGGVLWGSAGIVVPWETYLQYDDMVLLRGALSGDGGVRRLSARRRSIQDTGCRSDAQLGDWLGPQNNMLGAPFLATAYHVYDLAIIDQVAADPWQARRTRNGFAELHDERKAFFNARLSSMPIIRTIGLGRRHAIRPATAVHRNSKLADTQTSYAVGLGMGAV